MTKDDWNDWNNWLASQNWPQVHRDQVRKQAERCINRQHTEIQRLKAELAEIRNELEAPDLDMAGMSDAASRELIISTVVNEYGVAFEQITGRELVMGVVRARHALAFLLRELQSASFMDIGRLLNRDHRSVTHGCRSVQAAIEGRTPYGCRVASIYAALRSSPIDVGGIATQPRPSLPSVDSITMHVVQEFGVTLSAIRSARPASHARHVLCWLLREIRGETLSAIGGMVGGRNHGTVHAACKVVGDAVMANSALGKRAVRVRVLIESAGQMQEAS